MRCDCIPNADLDLGGKLNANTNPDWRIVEMNADPCEYGSEFGLQSMLSEIGSEVVEISDMELMFRQETSLIVPDFTILVCTAVYVIIVRVQDRLMYFVKAIGAFSTDTVRGLLYMYACKFITITCVSHPLHRPPWLLCRRRGSHWSH